MCHVHFIIPLPLKETSGRCQSSHPYRVKVITDWSQFFISVTFVHIRPVKQAEIKCKQYSN